MKRRIVSFILAMTIVLSIIPSLTVGATSTTAETATFLTRSDGIWFWPLPVSAYNSFSDWAGCNGNNSCMFHPGNNHGGCVPQHYTSNGYGHNGIDVGVAAGTSVYAAADGVLYCTSTDWSSRGITAIIEHPIGRDANGVAWSYYSIYQHLNSVVSTKDQTEVSAGDRIAYSGNTDGYGTGAAHLHFGIVLAKSGLGYDMSRNPNSVLSAVENKGWIVADGYQEGRIMNNPALNSPAGYPTGNSAVVPNLKSHAGSVMYTFNTEEVDVGVRYLNYYSCDITFEITTACNAWSMPGSDSTYPDSAVVTSSKLPVGTQLKATAIYENKVAGHYWYETKINDKTAYVYVPYTNHLDMNWTVSASDVSKPTEIVLGNGFGIAGTIKTAGSTITQARGYVFSGNATNGTAEEVSDFIYPNNTSCSITGTINNTLIFNNIERTGYYTYVVKVKLSSWYMKDNAVPTLVSSPELDVEDTKSYFQVVASTSCSHSYASVVTAPTCTDGGYTTYTCTSCDYSYVGNCTDAVGHNYASEVINATCVELSKTIYTCVECGDSYVEYDVASYSDWSASFPTGVDESLVESRTEYRYQVKEFTTSESSTMDGWTLHETTTQWGDYGEWSSWSDTAVSASDTTAVETRKVYGYYYYLCSKCGAHMHGYGTCYTWAGGCGASTNSSGWHAIWSTTSWDNAGLKDWHGTGRYYTYIDGELVFKWTSGGSKTQYRYRTREQETVYHFYRWSDWSDWSASEVTASDELTVETRTVYRYVMTGLGEHKYTSAVTAPTCTEQGYTSNTCTTCGDSYVDSYVDATGIHTYENGICTGCGIRLPGDINGDGSLNNKDLTRLFQYLSGYHVEVSEAALDINGDGEVNNKDLTRLFRYLSGYEVELH